MIVYISGAISKNEAPYMEKFEEAQRHLESLGYSVLNPAMLPAGMPQTKYMPICIAMIDQSDVIYMLSDFRDSEKSMVELEYAMYQNKKILFE